MSNSHTTFFIYTDDVVVQDHHLISKKGLDHVDLAFEQIQLELVTKKSKSKRLLLDGSIRGKATPGRMLAIMGPSGAGKSTLLHALAGRIKDSKLLSLSGRRYINGHAVDGDAMIPAAFIEQEAA